MKDASVTNFGLVIAYLLPGFVALWAVSWFSAPVRSWLGVLPENAPSVGGFLYVTLASIVAGLTVSTVRWIAIDSLHHATGITQPQWDFSRLQENVAAFDVLVEIHYRYYQFYGNMLVSLLFVLAARRFDAQAIPFGVAPFDLGLIGLSSVFFAGSRDTLRKYYSRTANLLAERPKKSNARRRPGTAKLKATHADEASNRNPESSPINS